MQYTFVTRVAQFGDDMAGQLEANHIDCTIRFDFVAEIEIGMLCSRFRGLNPWTAGNASCGLCLNRSGVHSERNRFVDIDTPFKYQDLACPFVVHLLSLVCSSTFGTGSGFI